MGQPPLLVFTDLDGTLLDHETYSWDAAHPALAQLAEIGAKVVLASSKTAAEIAPLRAAMGLGETPAIVENGAGLLRDGRNGPIADDYARLTGVLDQLESHFPGGFQGFHQWTAQEIANQTGLTLEAASLAADRQFSIPGRWCGAEEDLQSFLQALAAEGVDARQGGRFLTLSFGATKADRMAEISAAFGDPPTLALGDAPNDIEMLETANHGAIIANPAHKPLPELKGETEGRIRRSTLPGPAGWNEMVDLIVRELTLA
ncbi:MAG: HAD-IIB family hydrolase [Pseudomonadota bacterium]